MIRTIPTLIMLSVLCSCASKTRTSEAIETVSVDLREFSCHQYDKGQWMDRKVKIGERNGAAIIAEHPCSDLCPMYTVRIVRFDVPLDECASVGGVIRWRSVPVSIMNVAKEYCVPPEAVCGD